MKNGKILQSFYIFTFFRSRNSFSIFVSSSKKRMYYINNSIKIRVIRFQSLLHQKNSACNYCIYHLFSFAFNVKRTRFLWKLCEKHNSYSCLCFFSQFLLRKYMHHHNNRGFVLTLSCYHRPFMTDFLRHILMVFQLFLIKVFWFLDTLSCWRKLDICSTAEVRQ